MITKPLLYKKLFVALGLTFFASSALSKAMVSKKTVDKIQLVSSSSEDRDVSGTGALSGKISSPKSPSPNRFGASNVQAAAGMMTGFEGVNDALVYSADARWHFYKGAFIPFGTSYWSSNLSEFSAAKISILTIETGLGYLLELSKKIAAPIGIRGGYAKMAISVALEDRLYEFEKTGKSIMPFIGLTGRVGSNILLGYEGRLPVLIFDKSENSNDEDESKSSSLPFYHMGTFAYQLR